MKQALLIGQLLVALALTGLILIQAKGTGLGRTFGSTTYHSKRGVEGLVFRATIGLAVAFVIVSIVNQLLL